MDDTSQHPALRKHPRVEDDLHLLPRDQHCHHDGHGGRARRRGASDLKGPVHRGRAHRVPDVCEQLLQPGRRLHPHVRLHPAGAGIRRAHIRGAGHRAGDRRTRQSRCRCRHCAARWSSRTSPSATPPARRCFTTSASDALPGQRVALVGQSGAGKSSFINLIPRFYDVTDGCVLIDGMDVRNLRQSDLRSHIALVLQETFLFNGTVQGEPAVRQAGRNG